MDCTGAKFRVIETSLCQVVQRTTNKPLNMVKRRQKEIEAWHRIVTRYDQRNTSDKNSEYAALIINISERDRGKDVEHFVDILTTFINDVNKSHHLFGKPTNEERTLAFNRLMCESLLNYGFRGTTPSYEELILAIENRMVGKTTTVSNLAEKTTRARRWTL